MNRIGIRRNHHIMWNPLQLSQGSIYAWYDASVPSSLTLVNSGGIDYVSNWASRIGASRSLIQSTSTRRPYYELSQFNKRMCVKFDHNNGDTTHDYLDGFNVAGFNAVNANLHMFVACRQTGPTIRAATGDATENYMSIFGYEGYHGHIALSSNSSGIQTGTVVEWWNAGLTSAKSAIITPTISPYQKLVCFGATIYGGTSGTWRNRLYYQNYVQSRTSTTEATNRRQYPFVNCRMGCMFVSTSTYAYPLKGEIYELLLITGTVSDDVKVKLLEYLSAKWGP